MGNSLIIVHISSVKMKQVPLVFIASCLVVAYGFPNNHDPNSQDYDYYDWVRTGSGSGIDYPSGSVSGSGYYPSGSGFNYPSGSGSSYFTSGSGSGYFPSGSGSGYYHSESGSGFDFPSGSRYMRSGSGYSGSGYYPSGSGSDYFPSGSGSGYYPSGSGSGFDYHSGS